MTYAAFELVRPILRPSLRLLDHAHGRALLIRSGCPSITFHPLLNKRQFFVSNQREDIVQLDGK